MISAVDLKTTFTEDAVEVLRLAVNEYGQEVFGEMSDAQKKRREQIEAVEEKIRGLQAEMVKLKNEKRTLKKQPCHVTKDEEKKRKREEAFLARRPKPGKG